MQALTIEVSGLTCARGSRLLFSNLSFSIATGMAMVVEGDNGMGKTTLLRCLAGMMLDYQGRVSCADTAPVMIGHSPGLSDALTAAENLAWYLALRGQRQDQASLYAALQQAGLAGFEQQPCRLLSAGQSRRVVLARLLLERADVWFLDEPAAALDDAGVLLVKGLCEHHLEQGGSIVVSTHTRFELRHPTQYLRLHRGRWELRAAPPLEANS